MSTIVAPGARFGRWTVLRRTPGRNRPQYWACRCDCGTTRDVVRPGLVSGKSTSCGCLHRERVAKANTSRVTHGEAHKTPEYDAWARMIARCHCKTHQKYAIYGGRGIVVCAEWRGSFEAFLVHVGRRPSPQHSLDRIDNSRGYEPGNVRWATKKQQSRNTRTNRIVSVGNEALSLAEWAERAGVAATTIARRLRDHWPAERAIFTPVGGAR